MDINIEKSNFTRSEICEFFHYLKGEWLWGINRYGNIEFVSRNEVGSCIATLYRLCYNKETCVYYFAYTRSGSSGTMFNHKENEFVVGKPIRCQYNGIPGEFVPDGQLKKVSRPQTFNTVFLAAERFNKYFERKSNC